MNEPYWEVNDDEYEVIDMEAEEKLCNELISKKQAFQVIADLSNKMSLTCYDASIDGIAKARVIEAEPIRHGKWKYEYSLGMNYCSECGWGMVKGERRHYNYCPNCGARMDEVTE